VVRQTVQFLGGDIGRDLLVGQQRKEAVLEGPEAAFDFTLGLRTGGDQVGAAQCGERALELGAGIASIGGGDMAEQGETIGIQGQRKTVDGEDVTEVLEMMPGGIGGNEGPGQELAGIIIDGE